MSLQEHFKKLQSMGCLSELIEYDEWYDDLDTSDFAYKQADLEGNTTLFWLIEAKRALQREQYNSKIAPYTGHISSASIHISPMLPKTSKYFYEHDWTPGQPAENFQTSSDEVLTSQKT